MNTPQAQRRALELLLPSLPRDTYLGGGVAVAAYLAHRVSHDLDLFMIDSDPLSLVDSLSATPEVRITARSAGTLYIELGGIPASLLRYPYPVLFPPAPTGGLPVPVASLDDLACMKLSAIAGRGAARDFWDLHAILTARGAKLPDALDAFERKYAAEDRGHIIRSLVYFGDADAAPLPNGLDAAQWRRIREDFERWVERLLAGVARRTNRDVYRQVSLLLSLRQSARRERAGVCSAVCDVGKASACRLTSLRRARDR
jgi:hypothetical protein